MAGLRTRTASLILLLILCACGEGQQGGNGQAAGPACRMSSITLDPVTKERDNLNNCGAAEYAAQCDEGVTAQDQKCSEQCALYKKRAQAPATGDLCKANPVQATSPAFKDGFCEKYSDNEGQQKYKVSCTVTATCTCDP